MERMIKSLSAIIGSSPAMRSSDPDQLLGAILEEVLKTVDGAVLGWICMVSDLPNHLNRPVVGVSQQTSVCLEVVRHADKEAPTTTPVACLDCPCRDFLTGGESPPRYTVIDHCPHQPLFEPSVGAHACVAIFTQNRPIGVLNLTKAGSASFSDSERLTLQVVSSHISAALETAGLIGEA